MTANDCEETATIEFHYTEKYKDLVRQGEPYRWLDISVRIGGEYVYGDADSGISGFADGIVLNLLESAIQLLDGDTERTVLEHEFGPSWLVLEPRDGEGVSITGCISSYRATTDPDNRLDVDVTRCVNTDAWATAVVQAANDFCDTVISLNPELQDDRVMNDIQDKTDRLSDKLSNQ